MVILLNNKKVVEKMTTKIILILIIIYAMTGCMTVNHTDVPLTIKAQFDWSNLSLEQKIKLQEKFGGMRAIGTGQYDKTDQGGIHIDTTAKLEVIGAVADKVVDHASGIAKEAWSGAK